MKKEEVLKKYYGYDTFREGQTEVIDSLLAGRDAFGIMPTGAGKSVCYQVPALMLPGITLVVSPLISLMKDQVGALNEMGIHAAYLNSSLSMRQYDKALEYAASGQYKIIYVAPERLLTDRFLAFAKTASISMVTIDEAHCVSQWGQDFRPSYMRISEFIAALPQRPTVGAFTATATKVVQEDVVCILGLHDPQIVATGFDRKNLFFAVKKPQNKYEELSRFVAENRYASGIIYCSTRSNVEEVCAKLVREGYPATRYHAGLSDAERRQNQDDFIFDRKPIMVATNAFGMGIDKSNVRFVVHYNMPKDIESYYQEAGRAGRDGEKAQCILLYSAQDVAVNQFMIEKGRGNEELTREMEETIRERDRERLKKMTFYCYTNDCLRDYMLRYFGEYHDAYCGNCSNCLTQFETLDVTEICRNLIGIILEAHQRYGMKVMLDALHGSKGAKILQYRLDGNSFYGAEERTSIVRLRQVANHLQVTDYLFMTDTEYPLVKITDKGKAFFKDGGQVLMKLPKEREIVKKSKETSGSKTAQTDSTVEIDRNLFEELRSLRMVIAKEVHMPPYIIFSDKSLTDMCVKRPKNKLEMLEVNGVGEAKFEKYGERFLSALQAYEG